jgi:hypothetical protein
VHLDDKAKRPPGLFPGGRTFADKTWILIGEDSYGYY